MENKQEKPGQTPADGFNALFEKMQQMSQRMSNEAMRMSSQANGTGNSVMFDLMEGWRRFGGTAAAHPGPLIDRQMELWRNQMQIWQNAMMRMAGQASAPVVTPDKGDQRFRDQEWSDNPMFDFLKQSYLLTAKGIIDSVNAVEGIDDKTRQRLLFFTRQWINAVAPSNFLMTNPEVLRLTMESGGQNLIRGMEQLAEDMEKSADTLNIRMTDTSAFRLGENIATTPGKVVFRNRMIELIQYTPTTETVNKRPLVLVPPWINKFYIMDLREKNSFIRWAVAEGHTVFVISWVNPGRNYRDVRIDDYMQEGVIAALDQVQAITGERTVNMIGYCVGGMLLAMTLSWLQARGESDRVASATFWATIIDFSDPGDIGVFIDETIVSSIEKELDRNGVFDGRMMAVAFSLLRENDLYWNYYVQNYLKGERPIPFDLLYWNSDCTNLPGATHKFLLREFYLGNKLRQPGALTVAGESLDLSTVKTPVFVLATLQDHIAKWRSCYPATQVLGGPVKFVLGESGHIAGVMNPPDGKYGYYAHDGYPADADEWYAAAQKQDRSWWLEWKDWVQAFVGEQVPARQPGANGWPVLGDAPGSYVKMKADEVLKAG
ncbi:MAG: class I poly(R)-hydroxyalkanoic acid synthase [Fluviicoccus sp.]|uniref:class I poly(R)-hydroxyalkanoic acid synthase n=1 Tax=Fluviicoccus sp. TaxID=2003552 RepID=UPI00272687D1|nr:class I poly(R)-hydroxyalkanoic acid synthase [Fluviicoccus sp.]MDO8330132.1 class I poly(R)-hydroxyalkanoic acid synthase [Fluviicoccus sp.]